MGIRKLEENDGLGGKGGELPPNLTNECQVHCKIASNT